MNMTKRMCIVCIIGLAAGMTLASETLWPPASAIDAISIGGRVTSLDLPHGFVLDRRVVVSLSEATVYSGGLTRVYELRAGQQIEAVVIPNRLSGKLEAIAVRLSQGSGDVGETFLNFVADGRIERIIVGRRFLLDNDRVYEVAQDAQFFGNVSSFEDLQRGQFVGIAGYRVRDGRLLVTRLIMHGEEADGGYLEVQGLIKAVSEDNLVLHDGQTLNLTETTRYRGDADVFSELRSGFAIRALVLRTTLDQYLALIVWSDDRRDPTTRGQEYEPYEALVVAEEGVDVDALAARFGGVVRAQIPEIVSLFHFNRVIDDELLLKIAADPSVIAVEPNYLFRDPESVRRRYPIVDLSPAYMSFVEQNAAVAIDLSKAQEISLGEDVVVAVIDNGIDPRQPLLAGRIVWGGLDLIDGDRLPWESANGEDEDLDGAVDEALGHGTFVSTMIALVAPEAKILPYRVLDDDGGGTAFHLAVAIAEATAREVDVINLSLEYHQRSTVVDALIETAFDRGIVIVAAAGNDGTEEIPFPASDSNTIGVTAMAADGEALWVFANRGKSITIAAPGEDLYGGLPEGVFGTWEGTSFACPLVSGVAALILSTDPTLDPELVEQAIFQGGIEVNDGIWSGSSLNAGGALELLVE